MTNVRMKNYNVLRVMATHFYWVFLILIIFSFMSNSNIFNSHKSSIMSNLILLILTKMEFREYYLYKKFFVILVSYLFLS